MIWCLLGSLDIDSNMGEDVGKSFDENGDKFGGDLDLDPLEVGEAVKVALGGGGKVASDGVFDVVFVEGGDDFGVGGTGDGQRCGVGIWV